MTTIRIINGTFNVQNQEADMSGYCFTMTKPFRIGTSGGYVTVDGSTCYPKKASMPERNIRIWCEDETCYEVIDENELVKETMPSVKVEETDDEIINRLRDRFDILQEMTKAVKRGDVKAMIVTGPPGVGKSYGVEDVLSKDDLFDILGDRKPKYQIVKGSLSALGLYAKLYEFSGKNNIIVFDDADSSLDQPECLGLLKAALDSSKRRIIHWNSDSSYLRREDIPNSFEFKGGVVFITNLKFELVRSKQLKEHLAALESRCHFIDLKIDTDREKMLRIKQIISDGMLNEYNFTAEDHDEIVEYISNNKSKLRELSLRTVLKAADLKKSFDNRWKAVADVTLLKN